jgi:hypothetical protein
MNASKQEDVTAALTSLADADVVVKGIVHPAGVLEDATLSLQDVAKFERVMLKLKAEGSSKPPFFCVQGAGRGDFLYAEIAKPLGVGQPSYVLRGIGYDFQEVSDLVTHFADEIECLCSTGLIQVGGWSAPSADVWPMRSSCSWFVEVNRGAV